MDIVIISEFIDDFTETDNDRFLYIAKKLADGNDVEIVTSSFRHTTKMQRTEPATKWPFRITFIEEPGYPKNICLQRFRSHRIWGRNLLKYISNRKEPDVIYCAVPSLTGPNLVAKYCERKRIRFIIDVQDLWPEAFQMVLHIPMISNIIFTPFTHLVDGIYKRADAVCAVSDTYCQRVLKVNKKALDSTTVFLGTELDAFDHYVNGQPALKKKDEEIWIGYAGTLGTSYDLPIVFDALKYLNNPNIHMIVMGDGPLMNDFQEKARGLNVNFMGRIPYEKMCSVLTTCDMVVNPIIGTSVATIINKHADYAASGKPVLNTQNSQEYKKLVETYEMGYNCLGPQDLAEKIKILAENTELRKAMGKNARRCAEEKFDRRVTYQRIAEIIVNNH